jgi:hypothetical protein
MQKSHFTNKRSNFHLLKKKNTCKLNDHQIKPHVLPEAYHTSEVNYIFQDFVCKQMGCYHGVQHNHYPQGRNRKPCPDFINRAFKKSSYI